MATRRYYSANAIDSTVFTAINSSATTVVLASSPTGYPGSYPYVVALDYNTASEELVLVTGASGSTLTITRGFNGTSAQAHGAGAVVRHVIVAQDLTDFQDHAAASTGVHGVTGAVVGTTDTQTLTNKTITNGVLSGTLSAGGGVGTAGQVLQSTGSGVQWGNVSSTPRIGQVVTATTTSSTAATGGAGWVDVSGLSVTITPTSSTSKIFIATTFTIIGSTGSTVYASGYVQLLRGSTSLSQRLIGTYYPNGGNINTAAYNNCAFNYVDSPASTSAQTYKMQINNILSANNFVANPEAASVQITAMEILV